MKLKDIMTQSVVSVSPGESVEVAARALARYNIGALPVCTPDKRLLGMVTDRDLVTRCIAAGRSPRDTKISDIMTAQVRYASPDMEVGVAAHLMGAQQIRRLPVVDGGRLCGMVSLGDMACRDDALADAADALSDITAGLSPDW
jgi:CBS domain-containing protein